MGWKHPPSIWPRIEKCGEVMALKNIVIDWTDDEVVLAK